MASTIEHLHALTMTWVATNSLHAGMSTLALYRTQTARSHVENGRRVQMRCFLSATSVSCLQLNTRKVGIVADNWNRQANPYEKEKFGQWSLKLPPKDGKPAIEHGSIVKVMVVKDGNIHDKISPWAKYVEPNTDTNVYHQVRCFVDLFLQTRIVHKVFYNPPSPYQIQVRRLKPPRALRIYESHVGISSPEGKVASYRYFADNVLPRVARQSSVKFHL